MKEKLKSLQINFTLIAFLCFTIKILAVSATFPDSVILFSLGAVYSYGQYLKRFQPYKLDEAVHKDLLEVKGVLTKLNLARALEKKNDNKYF